MSEFIFNVFLLGIFCVLFVSSFQIEIWNNYVGARYWPMLLIGIGIILLLAKVILAWRKIPMKQKKIQFNPAFLNNIEKRRLLSAFLLCFLYVILLPKGGFLLTTILFGMGLSRLLGASKLRYMLLAGCSSALPIFAVFVWGLNMRLPRGVGIFYSASIWVENLIG